MPTANLSRSLSIGGVVVGGVVQSFTSDDAQTITKLIPANSTNFEIDVQSVTMANAIAYGMHCTAAATVKTNDSASPVDTLALLANDPEIFATGDVAGAKPISATTLTKLFVTCTVACTFVFIVLTDVTPGG